MDGNASFNAVALKTYNPATRVGININLIEHSDLPDMSMSVFPIADANRSSIASVTFPSRKVRIAGSIHGSTQADIDDRIDAFMALFNGKEKNLDITYGSGVRRYIATKNAITVSRRQRTPFATFAVEFLCTHPFGQDTATTSLANNQNYTSATLTVTPTVGGTAPVQYPIITLTLDALTGTGDYVQITNNANDQQMLLYGFSLTAGSVIVIDSFKRTVTINGSEVDYRGTFLELEPGASSITYTDGFTTRTVDIVIAYYKRWL